MVVAVAVLEDALQTLAGDLHEITQEDIGGAVDVGQEDQAWRQVALVRVVRVVEDEEAGEVDVR
jgi:hypothetical protein